jgi:hypothetical protein
LPEAPDRSGLCKVSGNCHPDPRPRTPGRLRPGPAWRVPVAATPAESCGGAAASAGTPPCTHPRESAAASGHRCSGDPRVHSRRLCGGMGALAVVLPLVDCTEACSPATTCPRVGSTGTRIRSLCMTVQSCGFAAAGVQGRHYPNAQSSCLARSVVAFLPERSA